jgi:hypothetical protein
MVINREWGLAMNENPLQGSFERWDLVETCWSLGSVLVLLAGAALAVLGVVAAARTGINDTWYRPVEDVAGLRHTPLLAALEVSAGCW